MIIKNKLYKGIKTEMIVKALGDSNGQVFSAQIVEPGNSEYETLAIGWVSNTFTTNKFKLIE